MLKIHYLQHVPFEGLGSIAIWARSVGCQVEVTKLYAGEQPPAVERFDWLIIMGGPMGADDEKYYPWLTREKTFIGQAIERGKTVLGICLGAQLIARVMGAAIHANPQREIGWFPVYFTPAMKKLPLSVCLPDGFDVFHWHGDTFDIPSGAVHLLRSDACQHQAFLYDNRVLALQFHLETTWESAVALLENCGDELVGAPYVQTPEQILGCREQFAKINQRMNAILDYLAGISINR